MLGLFHGGRRANRRGRTVSKPQETKRILEFGERLKATAPDTRANLLEFLRRAILELEDDERTRSTLIELHSIVKQMK